MKCFVRKTLTGWAPADEQAQAMHKRQSMGRVFRADIVQPRNYRHHCLFMALLDLTFQNQELYENDRDFRRAVAFEAGHVHEFRTLDGEILRIPRSYSYDEIPDEHEFTKAFGAAMRVCAKILHDMDLQDLEDEVSRYADQHYGLAA